MAINKIVYDNQTLIDLTGDTVEPEHVLIGKTFHYKSGEVIVGECDFDSNTYDADAVVGDILINKTAYVDGQKIVGQMQDNGSVYGYINTVDGEYNIPDGYHDGNGVVQIADVEQGKIIPSNIKLGVTILGIEGTFSGETIFVQSKVSTPSVESQIITPDVGYDYLSQVTVEPIPFAEEPNPAGGYTAMIG